MFLETKTKYINLCARLYAAGDAPVRKDQITPYIVHPMRVSALFKQYSPGCIATDKAQMICIGHDLFEDTDLTKIDFELLLTDTLNIDEHTASYISYGIWVLTEDKNIHPRKLRIETYYNKLIEYGDVTIRQIKLADRLDNLLDDGLSDDFLRGVYLYESQKLHDMIRDKDGESLLSIALQDRIDVLNARLKKD